ESNGRPRMDTALNPEWKENDMVTGHLPSRRGLRKLSGMLALAGPALSACGGAATPAPTQAPAGAAPTQAPAGAAPTQAPAQASAPAPTKAGAPAAAAPAGAA